MTHLQEVRQTTFPWLLRISSIAVLQIHGRDIRFQQDGAALPLLYVHITPTGDNQLLIWYISHCSPQTRRMDVLAHRGVSLQSQQCNVVVVPTGNVVRMHNYLSHGDVLRIWSAHIQVHLTQTHHRRLLASQAMRGRQNVVLRDQRATTSPFYCLVTAGVGKAQSGHVREITETCFLAAENVKGEHRIVTDKAIARCLRLPPVPQANGNGCWCNRSRGGTGSADSHIIVMETV